MTDVTVVVEPEIRVRTGETIRASVPTEPLTALRVVRLVQLDRGAPVVRAPDPARQSWRSGLKPVVGAIGLFIVVISACLSFLALLPVALGYRPVAVTSASMSPALRTGDVVVTRSAPPQLPVGAVIDFRSGERQIMHRIVEVTAQGYRTKGDANRSADGFHVDQGQVDGLGVMVVPLIGWPLVLVDQRRWFELAGVVGAVVAAGVGSLQTSANPPIRPTGT